MSGCCFGFESAPSGAVVPGFITSVSNTNSINLGVALGNLTSNLIVDPNPLNVLSVGAAGALVLLSGGTTELAPVISQINNPPAHVLGERYLVGIAPTGAWVGFANNIAESDGATWTFTAPILDNTVYVTNTLTTLRYNGVNWVAYSGTAILQNGNLLGAAVSLGTNDAFALQFKTNNIQRGYFTSTGLLNIGNAIATGQRLVRIGQDTAWMDLGSVVSNPTIAGIYFNTVVPNVNNYNIMGNGGTLYLNANTTAGAIDFRILNNLRTQIANTFITMNPGATTGLATTPFTFTTPVSTNQAASTETIGIDFNLANTITHATGAITLNRDIVFRARTHAFSGASVGTDFSTVSITGAVSGGTNATLNNSSALNIESRALTNVINSYSATFNVQTGAINNYVARFLGGNVGILTSAPNSSLQIDGSVSLPLRSIAAASSFSAVDYTLEATGAVYSVTLPTAVGIRGRIYILKNVSGGAKTLITTGGEFIDGALTRIVTAANSMMVQSNGTNWIIIG